MTPTPSTWPDLIQRHLASRGDRTLYRFLTDGSEPLELTFADLDRHARAIAVTLTDRGAAGHRVVLAHPPGLAFAAAFMGCLYAGAVAVPTFAPRLRDRDRSLDRFAAILSNARPTLVLTTSTALDTATAAVDRVAPGSGITAIASDTIDLAAADGYRGPAVETELACLQYTSGTCGTPKGVMLSHAALLANSAQIAERFGSSTASSGVIWLPPHHDMGLMGGILHPLITGFECTLMAPTTFLQRPARWLEAVSKYRATISGGPCFAYGAVLDSVDDAMLATLDLSRWLTPFCGAERIRPGVMQRFAERFAPAGFRANAFVACYGMAEATLMISSARRDAGLSADAASIVDCGPPAAGVTVAIVDPATASAPTSAAASRCAPGTAGEIWIRSPALASGYWEQPELTAATFNARIAGENEPYLRTGDLGYFKNGGLFVTGRLKDLIIVRGVNHAPDDLEHAAGAAHAALQPHGAAAFSVDTDDGEQVVIVHELRREARNEDPEAIAAAIRTAVTTATELEVAVVILVRPGSVPRTTSGKVQRSACRKRFLSDELEPIWISRLGTTLKTPETKIEVAPPRLDSGDRATLAIELCIYLCGKVATVIGVERDQIEATEPLARYGIGSADAVGLAGQISNELGIDLPAMVLWDYPTLAELTQHVLDEHAPIQQAA